MAASVKRTIRKTLIGIIEGKNISTPATPAELLKACRLLSDLAPAQKGKPRGRPFAKKAVKSNADRLADLIGCDPR